jgi:hypothetical protein
MNIGIIGSGSVGAALANSFSGSGHEVTFAARNLASESLEKALSANGSLSAKPPPVACRSAGDLTGKVLVDCTNPIGAGFTLLFGPDNSGGEEVARLAPAARVVKAFNTYGYENFADVRYPGYGDLRPIMFLCGNDSGAKAVVASLASDVGFRPFDSGDITISRYLEGAAMLWIKIARVTGKGAGFTWAMLER